MKELADAEAALLPPGEYLFWTPYDSYEAAAMLMQAFEDREDTHVVGPCVETHG